MGKTRLAECDVSSCWTFKPMPLETLKAILRRENELRTCDETQEKYAQEHLKSAFSGWLDVTELLQRQVCREFGFGERKDTKELVQGQAYNENPIPSDIESKDLAAYLHAECEDAVLQMRCALSTYPDDEDIKTIPLYIKYNRCRDGDRYVGEESPDVRLLKLTDNVGESKETDQVLMLSSLMQKDSKPLVLLGGSYT
jgi:hypothetical protein